MCRSDEDPRPVGERIAVAAPHPPPSAEAAVDVLELVRDRGEALRLRRFARLPPPPLAQLLVLGQALKRGRRELRLLEHARRSGQGGTGGRGLEAQARGARRSRDEDRGVGEHGGARLGRRPERTCTRSRSASGIPGLVESGFVRRSTASQPGSSRSERSAARRRATSPNGARSRRAALRARPEELGVDAGRDDPVVAREAVGGGGRGRLRRRRSARRSGPAASPQSPPRRIAEPVGREEARDPERLGVAQGEVGDAREAGLEAVDDVEAALLQRQPEVRANADGDAEARAARHRHRRSDRDRLRVVAAGERTPPGGEIGRPARRSDHGDGVPSARSSFAIPATCWLTSCGSDHANGVTKQIFTRDRVYVLVAQRRPESRPVVRAPEARRTAGPSSTRRAGRGGGSGSPATTAARPASGWRRTGRRRASRASSTTRPSRRRWRSAGSIEVRPARRRAHAHCG